MPYPQCDHEGGCQTRAMNRPRAINVGKSDEG